MRPSGHDRRVISKCLRLVLGLSLGVSAGGSTSAAELAFTGPITAGELEAPPKHETSGIAASRRQADILWVHDDSGGAPVLYAVNTTGKKLGAVRVTGVKNDDWEDVASYEQGGEAWLLIADTGDNDAKRGTVWLHVIKEPKPEQLSPHGELSAAPVFSIRLRYEDGPRDCESVAVDVAERAVYLLTKRDEPARVYRIDLAPPRDKEPVVARLVGMVPHVPAPTILEKLVKGHTGKRRGEVCAMDFSADGRTAVILSYGAALVFERRATEPWAETLAREPLILPGHGLLQAEAACFSSDGKTIFVASEGRGPFVRYDRR
jgi:hypothetical protein